MLGVPSLHHKHHAIYIDMLGVPSYIYRYTIQHHAIYIDMLGVPSLHHKHHACTIYIDMLGVPSLHHKHHAVLFI